nr:10141_t:CDS:2 [Entrophospora candida]CAG8458659.1 7422_t:CDS:2 [Entrophospora candida]
MVNLNPKSISPHNNTPQMNQLGHDNDAQIVTQLHTTLNAAADANAKLNNAHNALGIPMTLMGNINGSNIMSPHPPSTNPNYMLAAAAGFPGGMIGHPNMVKKRPHPGEMNLQGNMRPNIAAQAQYLLHNGYIQMQQAQVQQAMQAQAQSAAAQKAGNDNSKNLKNTPKITPAQQVNTGGPSSNSVATPQQQHSQPIQSSLNPSNVMTLQSQNTMPDNMPPPVSSNPNVNMDDVSNFDILELIGNGTSMLNPMDNSTPMLSIEDFLNLD